MGFGWFGTVRDPGVNSAQSGQVGRLGLIAGNRHVCLNKRMVSLVIIRKIDNFKRTHRYVINSQNTSEDAISNELTTKIAYHKYKKR